MKFTNAGITYEMDNSSITFDEAEALESVSGLPYTEIGDAIIGGALKPLRAMIWATAKRTNPAITFAEVGAWVIEGIDFQSDTVTAPVNEDDSKKVESLPEIGLEIS